MILAMQKPFILANFLIAASALLFAALAGLAFAGWMSHADKILFSMIQSGLAWCF